MKAKRKRRRSPLHLEGPLPYARARAALDLMNSGNPRFRDAVKPGHAGDQRDALDIATWLMSRFDITRDQARSLVGRWLIATVGNA